MKKLFPFTLIFLITLTLLSQAAIKSYGKENNKQEIKIQAKPRTVWFGAKQDKNEIKIKSETEIEVESEVEIENGDNKNRIKIKIENDKGEFKIWGPIQSFTASSITIDGKTITIDPNTTEKFKQVGILNIGMYARVEGVIINDIFYAEKIVVDQRNKNEIDEDEEDDDDEISPTPSATPTGTLTPTIIGTPTVTPSETPTPTATETPILELSSGDAFILDQIILNLQNLLRKLLRIPEE